MLRLEELSPRLTPSGTTGGVSHDRDGTLHAWTALVHDGPGVVPDVEVLDGNPGASGVLCDFRPFPSSYVGEAKALALSTSRNLGTDILTVTPTGAGGGAIVMEFDPLTGKTLRGTFLFPEDTFRGGINYLSASDVNGDGVGDLFATPGKGGGAVLVGLDGATGQVDWAIQIGPLDDRDGDWGVAPAGLNIAVTHNVNNNPARGPVGPTGFVAEKNHDTGTDQMFDFYGNRYSDPALDYGEPVSTPPFVG